MNQQDFLLPVPANPPDAGSMIAVQFGADWIPVILSALELLRFEELWLSPPADIIPQIDELINRMQNTMIISPQVYPKFQLHFHKFSRKLLGSAIALSNNAVWDFSSIWWQFPPALNDRFEFDMMLEAGTYEVTCHGQKGSQQGIVKLTNNDGYITLHDLYNPTTVNNAAVAANMTVVTTGNHLITGEVASRNVSSTNYYAPVTAFGFRKL